MEPEKTDPVPLQLSCDRASSFMRASTSEGSGVVLRCGRWGAARLLTLPVRTRLR